MLTSHDTVSIKAQANHLFAIPDYSSNRRSRRSGEPAKAVGFQLERVYDFVSSEAIVLCDALGRNLKAVGDRQLCKLLSYTAPDIFRGDTDRVLYHLKALDILRPGIDCSHISMLPITVPHRTKKLFVASVSESHFNEAGVFHATGGIRRILGVPTSTNRLAVRPVSSRDRLAYDIAKAIYIGYHDFFESPLAQEYKVPRRFFGPGRGPYQRALEVMLERVDKRLNREGMTVDRPSRMDRFFKRGIISYEGYKNYLYQLPVRIDATRRRIGTLNVQMAVYEKHFEIPVPPKTTLQLD